MAVENELIYIVRLNAEGEEEVVKARRVIDETGKAATKSSRPIQNLGKQMSTTSQKTRDFNARGRSANIALMDMTRIAQDAPYGIRGIANNLEQAAMSSTKAVTAFGGVGGALKAMGQQLTGVGGVVAAVTAFNLVIMGAQSGLFSFGEEAKDFNKDSDKLIEQLQKVNEEFNDLRNLEEGLGFLNNEGEFSNLRLFSLAEEDAKDAIRQIENYQEGIGLSAQQWAAATNQGRVNVSRAGEITVYLTKHQREALKQYRADLEEFGKEIDKLEDKVERSERLKQYPTVQDRIRATEILKMEQEIAEGTRKMMENLDLEPLNIDTELVDDNMQQKLKRQEKQTAERYERMGQEQLQFERELQKMRLSVAKSSADKMAAIALEEQLKIEEVRQNELLTARQKEEALTLIKKKYEQKRADIEIEEKKRAEREVDALKKISKQKRILMEQQAVAAISSLQQGFASQNKALAVGVLAVEKGLQIANVVADTSRKVAQAMTTGFALAANPATAPLAANAFAQASAIKATGAATVAAIAAQTLGEGAQIFSGGGGSGGTGGGNIDAAYRGMQFSQPLPDRAPSQEESGRYGERSRSQGPRDIRIVDGFGRIVARGQEENDRRGGSNYMRGEL